MIWIAHAAQPSYLALTNFGEVSTRASIRCCVRTGILLGFPGSSVLALERARCPFSQHSEVLASTDHPIRFSPVVGARCRPPLSKITLLHPFMGKTMRIIRNPPAHCKQRGNKNEIKNMVRTKSFACPTIRESRPCPFARLWCGRILARANSAPDIRHRQAQAEACAVTKGTGYATYSAGGRGASAAGPEIPKEAGPRRRAQRRGAGDTGGIPTRSMRPHLRTDARPYAERGIAGGAGMRRSAANAPRATAGNAGIQGGRRADGGAAAKNSPPKAISRLPSAARARRMRRKTRTSTPPGISRRFAGTGNGEGV